MNLWSISFFEFVQNSITDMFKTPSQIHYRNMKVNNLSKSPSLAFFFIWKVGLEVSLVCFVSLKKKTCETRKNIFTLLRKGSWDFNFSDIQMSWRHQMSKLETQNRFHWITWEVNKVWQLKLASLCYIAKETFLSKNSKKNKTWKLVPRPFQFSKNIL